MSDKWTDMQLIADAAGDLTTEQAVKYLKYGAEMEEAAKELAEYASYAEIVGGVSHNRSAIRKWCDKVFELLKVSNATR